MASPKTIPIRKPLPSAERLPVAMAAIVGAIQAGDRFLVCSHSRPDGDAVGSMLAMGMLLHQLGKHADLVTADRIPPVYRSLPGADQIQTVLGVHGHYDAVILLECDSLQRTRLSGLDAYFQINIDHHTSGREFAQLNWIDRRACSCGELVHRLVLAMGAHVTPEMAASLYTTLLTDTGGFCYGTIEPETFALAHELTLAGADPVTIARDIYFAAPLSKMQLLGKALSSLQAAGPIAWVSVTDQQMQSIGATDEDCEGIVNYALSITGIQAAAFLRELPEGRIRLSLRGKGRVNVAAVAERLGGGGHENAAGCTLEGPIKAAETQILAALRAHLD